MVAATFLPAILFLSLYTTANAQAGPCTTANATPAESLSSGGNGSSSSGNTSSYNSDFAEGISDSLAGSTLGSADTITSATSPRRRRAVLSCTSSERCFSLSNVPLCVNTKTGDYHADGERGNIVTGDYVLDNGQRGNLFSTVSATGSATAAPTRSSVSRATASGSSSTTTGSLRAQATESSSGTSSQTTTTATSTGTTSTPTATGTSGAMSNKAGLRAIALVIAVGTMLY